ncbi:RimK family alpha-L-glutamate ligase [Candidatus Bathyarchaeota archaeon]|nr:MAG: RimK family alpha-L-glutamate ligase [Candidatus Bathyarchaeota archaeon]
MRIGILTKNPESWHSKQLEKATIKNNAEPLLFRFSEITAKIEEKTKIYVRNLDVAKEIPAIIVRPIGRGSLEEIIFRLDVLHTLERLGTLIINPPKAIEISVDKYYSLTLLKMHGIPVPKTVATESLEEAIKAFNELGGDVVTKPLFGSRGIGSTRISDPEVATRIFRALSYHHNVLYLQKYIEHGFADIRAFVVGDRVIASMKRMAQTWKTNISLGARPKPTKLSGELEDLAVKSAKTIGCKIAGVDIIESEKGPLIVEINSQPGWRGLQTVTRINIADEIVKYVISELKK